MYHIERTKKFYKVIAKLKRSGRYPEIEHDLEHVIDTLAAGGKLEERFRDHKLHGSFQHLRECHVKSDVLLVYQIYKEQLILVLMDLGSHSYFFE